MALLTLVVLLALFQFAQVHPAVAAVYGRLADLPSRTFDFVIVGAGAAGNVLANRLTEHANFNVLVLEAGGSNQDEVLTMVPFFCTRLSNTIYDWNYTTTPQPGLMGRSIAFPRGHVLGGSTSINGMFYSRGSFEDYDRYAKIAEDAAWSWKSIQRYNRRNEMFFPPADHHDTTGQYDPSFHSARGINSVSLPGYPQSINHRIIQTTQDLSEFSFNRDMNSGNSLGLGWLQATIKGGRRSSSATSYLGPKFISRPNLHVLMNARVTRVLAMHHDRAFQTVEFLQGQQEQTQLVHAQKEVILSAGTIGTPHILLNSGIGDRSELSTLGIPSTHHLPDVGKNLTDHPRLASNWFVRGNERTFDNINQNVTLATELLDQWEETQTGPLVDTFASHLFFARLPPNFSRLEHTNDPAAGPNSPHYELGFSNGFVGLIPSTGTFIGITTRVVSPTSRGSVKLKSNNPLDFPLIDPGLLATEFDISTMREAVKSAWRFLRAPAWKGYVLEPYGALANATTDALLDDYIRSLTGTSAHCVGTAGMSARSAAHGVVDPDFKVKGLDGLRIVDASVLPFVPSAHTQAPVYIFAERAADVIKAAWR
ncbi:Pyranose dehydrogenase [Hypsizygus marmoreus]|uniref:Pyranose dehydrogenase n=1 Tax=Hypsizygus marmoreus TaxID=39966 RepID=A0A369JG98_HYPMA|nr:Pyranose dehydrogenase [Hypsizygus marmoreus]